MDKATPKYLQARMEKLVRDIASYQYHVPLALESEALAIVAELPKPIDPDVLAVREILHEYQMAMMLPYPGGDDLSFVKGSYDDIDTFKAALSAYKRIKADRA